MHATQHGFVLRTKYRACRPRDESQRTAIIRSCTLTTIDMAPLYNTRSHVPVHVARYAKAESTDLRSHIIINFHRDQC